MSFFWHVLSSSLLDGLSIHMFWSSMFTCCAWMASGCFSPTCCQYFSLSPWIVMKGYFIKPGSSFRAAVQYKPQHCGRFPHPTILFFSPEPPTFSILAEQRHLLIWRQTPQFASYNNIGQHLLEHGAKSSYLTRKKPSVYTQAVRNSYGVVQQRVFFGHLRLSTP